MPLNDCLTPRPLHRLPFWTPATVANKDTEPGSAAERWKWQFLTTQTLLEGYFLFYPLDACKNSNSKELTTLFSLQLNFKIQMWAFSIHFILKWIENRKKNRIEKAFKTSNCTLNKFRLCSESVIQSFSGGQKHKQEEKEKGKADISNVMREHGAESDHVGAQGGKIVPSSTQEKRWIWKQWGRVRLLVMPHGKWSLFAPSNVSLESSG